MDPALITPLTEITDYLLQCKPGSTSIPNIVKISQYYGFESFNENNRLTIAGKIILIDIDYEDDDELVIQKISMSLAVDLKNDKWNFIKSFDSLLYNNLKETDLFKFNNNFKKLSVLDKFSSLKFDLFNYLTQEINKLSNVKLNLNDDLGYYLHIHQNYKYLNAQLNTLEQDNFYLEINTKETKDTMINDLKCGICLELVGDQFDGLVIPELILMRLGVTTYDIFQTETIPTLFHNYKVIALVGSRLINLKQFYLADLSKLDQIIPVLQNWYLINNVLLKKLVLCNPEQQQQQQQEGEETETNDLNIDDYLSVEKRAKLIELILVDNHHLQVNVNGTTLYINDTKVTSDTDESIAEKVTKVEDLYRVLLQE